MKANGNFNDANLERLHWLSKSWVMSPSVAADLESPLSVGMRVSVLQPFWIAMIIFCWNVKLLKLPRVMLANICGTNSHNRREKGQPGVGVVKIFCDSDSSGSKSFRLLDSTAPIVSMLQQTLYETATSCERVTKQNLQSARKYMDFLRN